MKPVRHTTARLARRLAVALLLATAACGGDGGQAPADDQAPDAGNQASGPVATREIGELGTVLVDADGMTLYTNEAEADGTVRCVEGCADFWPPVLVSQGSVPDQVNGVEGKLGEVTRPGGETQLTLDGMPLYTFAEDRAPGSAEGEGFTDEFQGTRFVWHAALAAGGSQPDGTEDGTEDGGEDGNGNGDQDGDDGGYDYGY